MVPTDYSEKQLCQKLRFTSRLLRRQPKGIRKYTIVTTTGCNARCPYCFEQGTRPVHMSMETAEKVAQYIIDHRGEHEEVQIDWFGGEPLFNMKVMDRISTRLTEGGVPFTSVITSNAYLFSEKMVEKAVNLWHLRRALITIDGTEDNYNRIKGYVHAGAESPYRRVLDNIERLLETEAVKVVIRIHLEHNIIDDVWALTRELTERFKRYDKVSLGFQPIYEAVGAAAKLRTSPQRQLVYDELYKLHVYACEHGIANSYGSLEQGVSANKCKTDSGDAVMIVPDGHLGLCEHHLENLFFGHIDSDEHDEATIRQSRELLEEIPECASCVYYPRCIRLKICGIDAICSKEYRDYLVRGFQYKMLMEYQRSNTQHIQP